MASPCVDFRTTMNALYATCLPSPIPISHGTPTKSITLSQFNLPSSKKWDSSTTPAAMPPSISTYHHQIPPLLVDVANLETEFGAPGVSFTSIGNDCLLKMELEDGTMSKLLLPSGLITSFKPLMWHGGTMQLLHTTVSDSIRGGISLDLDCWNEDGVSWSPNYWKLSGVSGSNQDSIRVELSSRNEEMDAEMKQIITLGKDVLTSEVVLVSNSSSSSSLQFTGSILCHLTVSTPDAVYALGLQGSDFSDTPPLESDYTIQVAAEKDEGGSLWDLFSSKSDKDESVKQMEKGEEEDNYKHLSKEISRIYQHSPRNLTIMDRGKRNSVVLRREGFEEMYLMSPGSEHEMYGEFSFICVGNSAYLQPITVRGGGEWRGSLMLFNPNS